MEVVKSLCRLPSRGELENNDRWRSYCYFLAKAWRIYKDRRDIGQLKVEHVVRAQQSSRTKLSGVAHLSGIDPPPGWWSYLLCAHPAVTVLGVSFTRECVGCRSAVSATLWRQRLPLDSILPSMRVRTNKCLNSWLSLLA